MRRYILISDVSGKEYLVQFQATKSQLKGLARVQEGRTRIALLARPDPGIDLSRPPGWRPSRGPRPQPPILPQEAPAIVPDIPKLEGDAALNYKVLEARLRHMRRECPTFDLPMAVLEHMAVTLLYHQLERVLLHLLSYHKTGGGAIDLDVAKVQIELLMRPSFEKGHISVEDIQNTVAWRYGITRKDLLSSKRGATIVKARQVAMYLARRFARQYGEPIGYPTLGKLFGGKNHTSVYHSWAKVSWCIGEREGLERTASGKDFPDALDESLKEEISDYAKLFLSKETALQTTNPA